MATKKIKWFAKDGSLLHPETEWGNITDKPTIPSSSDFVTVGGSGVQEINSIKQFNVPIRIRASGSTGRMAQFSSDNIIRTVGTSQYNFNFPASISGSFVIASKDYGTEGQVLTTHGSTSPATWETPSSSGGSALDAYPVGTVYIAYTSTSPASRFGGSWTSITGRFPYFNAGTSTGGSNTHTLTVNEMPSHIHNVRVLRGISHSDGTYNVAGGIDSNFDAPDWIQATGGGQPFSIMPAYQTLYAWRRTA